MYKRVKLLRVTRRNGPRSSSGHGVNGILISDFTSSPVNNLIFVTQFYVSNTFSIIDVRLQLIFGDVTQYVELSRLIIKKNSTLKRKQNSLRTICLNTDTARKTSTQNNLN